MENNSIEKQITRQSAVVYLPLSFGVALLFFLTASLVGRNPQVAIYGGTVWVLLLSLIVSMPLVTDRVKKRLRQ